MIHDFTLVYALDSGMGRRKISFADWRIATAPMPRSAGVGRSMSA
jgi:hypothetical protein